MLYLIVCLTFAFTFNSVSPVASQTVWRSPEAYALTEQCRNCNKWPNAAKEYVKCCGHWYCTEVKKNYQEACYGKFDHYYRLLYVCGLRRETCLEVPDPTPTPAPGWISRCKKHRCKGIGRCEDNDDDYSDNNGNSTLPDYYDEPIDNSTIPNFM